VSEVIGRTAAAITGDPVRAVSVSTHGESVVPVDAQGLPTYRFITAIDTRASEQARWWGERLGRERIFQITGMPLHPMYTVNKLMWLRQYDPAVYSAAHRFLCMQDFVFHQMGLVPTMDRTLAVRTMAFDVSRLDWAGEILELAQLDVERLSRVWPSGQVIGEIAPTVAEELGLAPGAVGVSGAHDRGVRGCAHAPAGAGCRADGEQPAHGALCLAGHVPGAGLFVDRWRSATLVPR